MRGFQTYREVVRASSVDEPRRETVEAERGMLDAIARVLAPLYATFRKNAYDKPGHVPVILVIVIVIVIVIHNI